MLDSLRKKDNRSGYTPPLSPYGKMQEALNPSAPAQGTASPEPARTEVADNMKPVVAEDMPAAQSAGSGSKLIVGPDIKLRGAEITDCDTLVVEGRVEASMDSRAIQIAEKGVFVGTCGVDVAEIRGVFEGELTVRKQLVIRSTGRISGKIRYGKVAIEEGGELSGDIASMSTDKAGDASWKAGSGSTTGSTMGSTAGSPSSSATVIPRQSGLR